MTPGNVREKSARKWNITVRPSWVLTVVVAIFVLPILIAWLYANGILDVRDRAALNRGILLTPPIGLAGNESTRRLILRARLRSGEWAVLYLSPGQCDATCLDDMTRLLTIRSVLGPAGTRVQILGVVGGGVSGTNDDGKRYADRVITDRSLYETLAAEIRSRDAGATFPAFTFFDWRGQMMMRFGRSASSEDIKKDLTQLLKASRLR